MKIRKTLLNIWATIFLVGCLQVSCVPTSPPPATGLPTGSGLSFTRSTTGITPLPLEVTSSPLVPPENVMSYRCMEIAPTLYTDMQMQGSLALFEGNHSILYDVDTGLKRPLDGKGDFKVSPDRKWLASFYVESNTKIWLSVESVDGKKQYKIPWEDGWGSLQGWLDGERVWINLEQAPGLVIINPFTGDKHEVIPDFPGVETIAQEGVMFPVEFNSDQSLAFYPRIENGGPNAIYSYAVLWDVKANRVVAKVEEGSKLHGRFTSVWSLDGKSIIVAIDNKFKQIENEIAELYSLGQDGQIDKLTHLEDYFTNALILTASLSPDGKQVAISLFLQPSPYQAAQLAILNLETRQLINYCIPADTTPVWSPDGRYIAVSNYSTQQAIGHAYILDTEQGRAARIADQLEPQGWMIGTP